MEALGHSLGSVGVLLLFPTLIAWFCLSVTLPFLCWSVTRNMAHSRRALERIAAALESGKGASPGGVLGL